jgi:REP element-mobilizing transposase RayT
MKYNPQIHNRKSIRLKGYDYSQAGLYFITICCENRDCLFGKIINGEMVLNDMGKMVECVWYELPQHYPDVQLGQFVVMPNHIHGVLGMEGLGTGAIYRAQNHTDDNLPRITRWFKGRATFECRKINPLFAWQRNYYEHIIRNEQSYQNISNYIINNPAKWQEDKFYIV